MIWGTVLWSTLLHCLLGYAGRPGDPKRWRIAAWRREDSQRAGKEESDHEDHTVCEEGMEG